VTYNNSLGEISGSHGDEYEAGCLLGCIVVWSGNLPMFLGFIALMMEAVITFEVSPNISD
jgi:hypothetical protein